MGTAAENPERRPAPDERVLVFLRHAPAEPRGSVPDAARALTPEGHQKMKEAARGLARIFPKAGVVLSSPLTRCVQTSRWVRKAFRERIAIEEVQALRPGAASQQLLDLIRQRPEKRLILVGHEPDLSHAVESLLGIGPGALGGLRKGGCYALRLRGGQASFEWAATPKILRRIGAGRARGSS